MANTLKFGDGKWATGEGTALAFNDENDNFKPLPFTFTRNSTATVVNESGLIEEVGNDVPRIDFKDNTKGALLLEPQRTNIFQQSNTFDQWSDTTIVLTSGQNGFAGSNDAWLMEKNGGNSRIFIAVTTSGVTTTSVYAKANASNYLRIRCDTTNATSNTFFNLSNGTIHSTSYTIDEKIEDVGGGWYRCSVVPRDPTTIVRLYPAEAGGSSNVSGSIYIQYAQLEAGSYPTSYIPTQGSAVTRVADSCNNAGNDQVINSTEGVLYAEISALANDGTDRHITINDGSSDNSVRLYFDALSNTIQTVIRRNSHSVVSEYYTIPNTLVLNKFAVKFKINDVALWYNGQEVAVSNDFAGFSAGTLNKVSFERGSNVQSFYGYAKEVKVYNTALSDSELAALTT